MRLSVEGISKKYGEQEVLKNISINFDNGKFFTLLGQSGCGKTTLLKIIAGLEEATTGRITFEEEVMFSTRENINVAPNKRQLSFVFQDYALWPHMTVYENVAFGLKLKKEKEKERQIVMEMLEKVRLSGLENRKPGELSGGQQQRVALARALAINPKVILFDEPLSALDAILREELQSEILDIIQQVDCKVIFLTHNQMEAMTMSDQILVMHEGKVVQMGTPEHIYDKPETTYVANLIGKANWLPNQQKMIRPEKLSLEKRADDVEFTGVIRESRFLGDRYLIRMNVGKEAWYVYTKKRLHVGERCSVYANKKDFHSVGGLK